MFYAQNDGSLRMVYDSKWIEKEFLYACGEQSICLNFDQLSFMMCIEILSQCLACRNYSICHTYTLMLHWIWHRKVSKTRTTASPLVFMPFDMNAMKEWIERASNSNANSNTKLGCVWKKKDGDRSGGSEMEREDKRECEIGAAYRVSSYAQLGYKPRRNRKGMLHTMICVCKHILKNVTKYVESGFCHFLVVIRVNRWNM